MCRRCDRVDKLLSIGNEILTELHNDSFTSSNQRKKIYVFIKEAMEELELTEHGTQLIWDKNEW